MGAREAWAWLQRHRPYGLRSRGLEFYAVTATIVEVSRIGTVGGTDLDEAAFVSDFAGSTFVPLDTADVSR